MTNNVCYCEGPWQDRALPKFMVDRAHVPSADCKRPEPVKPEWMKRKERGLLPAKVLIP